LPGNTQEVKNLIARTHYLQPIVEADDLSAYASGERVRPEDGDAFNPIQWWVKRLDDLPTVAQYALDLLCCPAMSAECERIFNVILELSVLWRPQIVWCGLQMKTGSIVVRRAAIDMSFL